MENSNKIGSFDYAEFKKAALANQLMQRKVSLSSIDITDSGQLVIEGVAVRCADGVFGQLLKILSLNPSFLRKFGKITDEKAKYGLVRIIKDGLALQNDKKSIVTVIASPQSKEVIYIVSGDFDIISNQIALDIFEKTMQADKDLELVNYSINNGAIEITAKKNTEIAPESNGKRLVGEEFNPGFTFKNSLHNGLTVSSYVERLVCTNGMINTKYFGNVSIKKINDTEVQKFFKDFITLQAKNFVPISYGENINRVAQTKASFAEIQDAKRIIMTNADIKEKDLFPYLPEFFQEVNKLARLGFDYKSCTMAQLKNLPTNHSVWDIINRLTDFGSHDYGFKADYQGIQNASGQFLNKDVFDTDNLLLF